MADPDILEELRADAEAGIGWAAGNLRRAADEIERLRATLAENDRLRLEIERLREHLARIEEWSRAYPETVFPMPDLKRAAEVLRAGGLTLDAISAHAMRHVVEGVGEITRCGLEGDR